MHSWITPRISLPVLEALTGRRIWSRVEELERLQWLPAERLVERADRKLGRLVAHAAENVPYYRDLLSTNGIEPGEITTVAGLERIPVSGKEGLRPHYPAGLLARNLPARRRQASFTSGSSGTPFAFYNDRGKVDCWIASYLFFLGWAGSALWHTSLIVSGPGSAGWIRERSKLERLARRLLLGEHNVLREGRSFGVEDLQHIVSALPSKRRYFVWSYASYAERLGRQMLDHGLTLPRPPEVVICAAETLTEAGKETVQRGFGCPAVRHYSCLEMPRLAQTCPDNPAVYHVNSERAWIRIVDESGRDVAPGERGRVVVTDLDNEVMPFINYDLGDIARQAHPCSCGRGLPTLGAIDGRQSEILVSPNGEAISPAVLGTFLFRTCDAIPFIQSYQLLVEGPATFTLSIVPTRRFNQRFSRALATKLAELFGPGTTISIEVVNQIATEPSGKRLIIKRSPSAPAK